MKTGRLAQGALLLVALGGGGWYFLLRGKGESDPPESRFQTAVIERGAITARVTATGTVSALVTVQVGSQVSGRLQEIRVDFNSEVKKGQVLARLDPLILNAALDQARANALAARGNLKKAQVQAVEAERQFKRVEVLAAKQFVSAADLDAARANTDVAVATAEAAEGQVAQTRAALRAAEVNLGYATIVSPIDGIVVSRSVDVGQTVAASFQAPVLFVLAEDLRKMQVDTSVAEADVGKLKPGTQATFSVDAWPGEKFTGIVRQIRNAPQTVQNVVTYDAVIDVANPEVKLRPGMTANVNFVVAERTDVTKIPNAALRFKAPPTMLEGPEAAASAPPSAPSLLADDPRRTLWVLREGKPVALLVRPGLTDGVVTEMLEGDLKPGDKAVTDMAQPASGQRRGMRFF